ncbi:hypothetical protein [Dokdonella sp.]|uniref:hypothetical protein n=1 Tax=Dokdonella sp. TaxID=2291710 RepID=UPI001B2633D5|nr:hypothetical protein [Dokdonella sp.]MBO9661426.1 hypothetical protein [Dokdonella sp.]
MISDMMKARVLLAVAEGQSLASAAEANGLSPSRGRDALNRLCRKLRMPGHVAEIHANGQVYRDAALKIIHDPKHALRRGLRDKLVRFLELRSAEDLTPGYVSNMTAPFMLDVGFSRDAVSEIQEWLLANGTRFKRQAPKAGTQTQTATSAALLLDAFGFDVIAAKAALDELKSSGD